MNGTPLGGYVIMGVSDVTCHSKLCNLFISERILGTSLLFYHCRFIYRLFVFISFKFFIKISFSSRFKTSDFISWGYIFMSVKKDFRFLYVRGKISTVQF